MWIKRDLSNFWHQEALSVRVLAGPRQSGKSSFLINMSEADRIWISLDDLAVREQATSDPETLLNKQSSKFVIDEIQYAPQLFNAIKKKVDTWRLNDRKGDEPSFWVTGSNQIFVDQNIQESLAGRASYFNFSPFSLHELCASNQPTHPEVLFAKGGWPELYANNQLNPVDYLNDYITTVIEKDVVQAAGITKVREFLKAVRLLAGRTGQMLVVSNIAQDAGIKHPTLEGWISVLEKMRIVTLVPPFYPSRNDRLIRAPKIFFNDVGLATRLQGWSQMQPLLVSPAIGALFETLVFNEIQKSSALFGRDWEITYSRNKENDEIDFVIEGPNQKTLIVEAKWSSTEASQWTVPKKLEKIVGDVTTCVVSFQGGISARPNIKHISVLELQSFLKSVFQI